MAGFIIGGHNMGNLHYADDTVLVEQFQEKMQHLLDKVVLGSKKKGLSINCNKI